jgi:hypothetical protein
LQDQEPFFEPRSDAAEASPRPRPDRWHDRIRARFLAYRATDAIGAAPESVRELLGAALVETRVWPALGDPNGDSATRPALAPAARPSAAMESARAFAARAFAEPVPIAHAPAARGVEDFVVEPTSVGIPVTADASPVRGDRPDAARVVESTCERATARGRGTAATADAPVLSGQPLLDPATSAPTEPRAGLAPGPATPDERASSLGPTPTNGPSRADPDRASTAPRRPRPDLPRRVARAAGESTRRVVELGNRLVARLGHRVGTPAATLFCVSMLSLGVSLVAVLRGAPWLAAAMVVQGNLGAICGMLAWRIAPRAARPATASTPRTARRRTTRPRAGTPGAPRARPLSAPGLPPRALDALDAIVLFGTCLAIVGSLRGEASSLACAAVAIGAWQLLIVRAVLTPTGAWTSRSSSAGTRSESPRQVFAEPRHLQIS